MDVNADPITDSTPPAEPGALTAEELAVLRGGAALADANGNGLSAEAPAPFPQVEAGTGAAADATPAPDAAPTAETRPSPLAAAAAGPAATIPTPAEAEGRGSRSRSRSGHGGDPFAAETVKANLAELEQFLSILEQRIGALKASTRLLERHDGHPPQFADYAHTRSLTSECLAFSIVIERRIDLLPDAKRGPVMDRFDRLTVSIWSTLLGCSLTFLKAIADEEHLPLGSREVFMQEIKTLYDAHVVLSQPRFEGKVEEETLRKRSSAERILTEIIERAPRLLDLSD